MSETASPYRRLLALPAPRRLALASVPADFADWLDYAAVIALLVFVRGEGPFALAFFAVALVVPYVVIGPLFAVLVDRTSLRRVLVLSNLGRAIVTAFLLLQPSTALVLALVFLRASVDSAFTPARQAAIQASTPVDLLSAANGIHQAINQTSKIVGPALGGIWIAALPIQSVFAANIVLSLVAAAVAARVILPARETAPAAERESFVRQATAGIREFRRNRLLMAVLIFVCITYFSYFLHDALIALLAADLSLGADIFGLSIAASGFGGLVGSLLAGRWSATHPILWMAAFAVLGGAVTVTFASLVLAGAPLGAAAFLAATGMMGFASGATLVPYRTIVQREVPPDRIGRASAAGEAAITGAMVIAPFGGSAIAAAFGTAAAFVAGGAIQLVLGLATPFVPALRGRPKAAADHSASSSS
ncbi:MAG: MFS transporter [Bauldia sp.]|nr:MFS transporter [Bauldia sp.]